MPAFKTLRKAAFPMGIEDYERFHEMLVKLDEVAINCRAFVKRSIDEDEALLIWYSLLKELYFNWKPLIRELTIEWYDKEFTDVRKKILEFYALLRDRRDKVEFPIEIVDKLDEIHERLFKTKSEVGLGFTTERILSKEQKIAKAI